MDDIRKEAIEKTVCNMPIVVSIPHNLYRKDSDFTHNEVDLIREYIKNNIGRIVSTLLSNNGFYFTLENTKKHIRITTCDVLRNNYRLYYNAYEMHFNITLDETF